MLACQIGARFHKYNFPLFALALPALEIYSRELKLSNQVRVFLSFCLFFLVVIGLDLFAATPAFTAMSTRYLKRSGRENYICETLHQSDMLAHLFSII